MCKFRPHRISELFTDPSSGDLSASRLGFLVVLLVFVPANGILKFYGYDLGAWDFLFQILGVLAGVYGLNSTAGAWKRDNFSPGLGPEGEE